MMRTGHGRQTTTAFRNLARALILTVGFDRVAAATARFRKPPGASQSLPNPAAVCQQPRSTPRCTLRSFRDRLAIDQAALRHAFKGASGFDEERMKLSLAVTGQSHPRARLIQTRGV